MNSTKKNEILTNLQYIKELSKAYYKKHNINFQDSNDSLESPFRHLFPSIKKRKISGSPIIKTKRFS